MELDTLTAIGPIDGRYRSKLEQLDEYFSEYALIKYRVFVETSYFIFLNKKKFFGLTANQKNGVMQLHLQFNMHDAREIKALEKITNHDVKAVEYFLKNKLAQMGLGHLKEWVHFGLTSQDINNTAIPVSWKNAINNEYLPALNKLCRAILQRAKQWAGIPMLARTHGQPASPTQLGKELMVYAERLENQVKLFSLIPFTGKFGGATGNFNAQFVAFPQKDWVQFANEFLNGQLLIQRQQYTTQIEHYDNLAAQFDTMKRINTILIDLCRDLWTYISLDYFKQKTKKGETGSSAMPHKVNPIDFENAEGNFGLANALYEHLAAKLPVSRLQRDLTDSTVLRNIGLPFAHSLLSFQSLEKGLGKLLLNETAIKKDLDHNWAVVAEAIQTILRRENYPNPYEALKELTRGKVITKETVHGFIQSLKIPVAIKKELKSITPHNYTGVRFRTN